MCVQGLVDDLQFHPNFASSKINNIGHVLCHVHERTIARQESRFNRPCSSRLSR
jgi:hypothetical protein